MPHQRKKRSDHPTDYPSTPLSIPRVPEASHASFFGAGYSSPYPLPSVDEIFPSLRFKQNTPVLPSVDEIFPSLRFEQNTPVLPSVDEIFPSLRFEQNTPVLPSFQERFGSTPTPPPYQDDDIGEHSLSAISPSMFDSGDTGLQATPTSKKSPSARHVKPVQKTSGDTWHHVTDEAKGKHSPQRGQKSSRNNNTGLRSFSEVSQSVFESRPSKPQDPQRTGNSESGYTFHDMTDDVLERHSPLRTQKRSPSFWKKSPPHGRFRIKTMTSEDAKIQWGQN